MISSPIRASVAALALLLASPSIADAQYAPAQREGSSDGAWPTMTLEAPDPGRIQSEQPNVPASGGVHQLTAATVTPPREPRAGGFEMGLFLPMVSIGGGKLEYDYDSYSLKIRDTSVGAGIFIGGGGPGFAGGFVSRISISPNSADKVYEFGFYGRPRRQLGAVELFATFGFGMVVDLWHLDSDDYGGSYYYSSYDSGLGLGFNTSFTAGMAFLRGPVHPYFDIGMIYRRVMDGDYQSNTYRMLIDIGVAFGG